MKIGITGGIGSGKSYVCDIIKKQGFPVFNCDNRAKQLMVENEDIKQQIINVIGLEAYTEDGKLNKAVISQFVFASKENQDKINAIVHPVVIKEFEEWADEQFANLVFIESAILFEAGLRDKVDKVIEVYAAEEIRINRTIKRDHITRDEVKAIMNAQLNETVKMKLSDYCIINNGNIDILKQLKSIKFHK